MHLGATVRQAQSDLQAASGSEPTLDEVARHLKVRSTATVQQRLRNAALAKELLLQYNVKLVISVARQYADRGVEFSDLLPAGVGGLERAIDRFDAAKGFKFSTYAHWWIRQAVSRCVQDQSRVVRLPVNVYELLSKINKVATRLNSQPDRQKPATYSEIAKALDIPVAKVIQVVRVSREAKSLDMPIDQSGGADAADSPALVDTLEADLGDTTENASQRALKEQVDLALKGLELRPRNILRYRYGLHHALGRALTLNEVGDLYGLKGERVRQIEGVAMAMLKKGLEHGLRHTLEETPED
jgi:RNA polymerase sigma factor (sigma-70 family)